MSRLVLTLTKQYQIISIHIFVKKTNKLCIECKFLKGLYFTALGFVEENATFTSDVFSFRRHIFYLKVIQS